MTAEVAVLNKSAVALAADSAMTTGHGKIYPANKLFALTKHHPVGVMIYNNAEFMGIPWETLIKMYRKRLGNGAQPFCEDYALDFLKFLGEQPIRTPDQEVVNLRRIAMVTYAAIRGTVIDELREISTPRRPASSRIESKAIRSAITERLTQLDELSPCQSMESVSLNRVLSDNRKTIDDCIDSQFDGLSLPKNLRSSLYRIFKLTLAADRPTSNYSGMVIAGFGEDEIFPTLMKVTTDGIVGGKVKHNVDTTIDIGRVGSSAYVMAFAQGEMVHQFMEGIDPDFLDYSISSTQTTLKEFGKTIIDGLDISDPKVEQAVMDAAEKLAETYQKEAQEFRIKKLVGPTMSAVSHLPMEELADMAEALVSLTSLRRRVSLSQETVGGPIDVAIISKGDGLIWVKRKHYFEPGRNPSYFDRQSLFGKTRSTS